jgi:hypothetical protein
MQTNKDVPPTEGRPQGHKVRSGQVETYREGRDVHDGPKRRVRRHRLEKRREAIFQTGEPRGADSDISNQHRQRLS